MPELEMEQKFVRSQRSRPFQSMSGVEFVEIKRFSRFNVEGFGATWLVCMFGLYLAVMLCK